ncbi:glycosyltransferase family 4 protein [bacterium]|nr:glycosyltransferase family 4 protein [candidate division CSSED10-310 bacterium]
MKKLAIIDLMFRWPPDGGARVDVKEVASRLAVRYDVTLFAPRIRCVIDRGEIEGSLPFTVVPIPFKPREFNGPELERRFRQALAAMKPDIVFLADGFHLRPWVARAIGDTPYFLKFYAYENLCNRYNGTFMRGDRSCYRTGAGSSIIDQTYCTLCGLKTILTDTARGHREMAREYFGARAWQLAHWRRIREMLDSARHIIVYNRLMQSILALHGWKSIVIPGGLDPRHFPYRPPRTPDGTIRLGMVGRIRDEQKGGVVAVRAMSHLRAAGYPVELHVTGNPEDELRYLPGVVFRGWFPHARLTEFYDSVDIVIVPSVWQEPFGIVVLEAMCSGRPVIASRVAGPMDILTHGLTGRLVVPNSVDSLAEQVIECMKQPEQTARIVGEANRVARTRYAWDTVVTEHYLPLVHGIVESVSGAGSYHVDFTGCLECDTFGQNNGGDQTGGWSRR